MKYLFSVICFILTTATIFGQDNINYSGVINSKIYITIKTPDGKYITIPVINGLLPTIEESVVDGKLIRNYSYKSGVKYIAGSMPEYHNKVDRLPIVEESTRKNDDFKKEVEIPLYIEKKSDELIEAQKTINALKEEIRKLQQMSDFGMTSPSKMGK